MLCNYFVSFGHCFLFILKKRIAIRLYWGL
jgi:hypothetical protein